MRKFTLIVLALFMMQVVLAQATPAIPAMLESEAVPGGGATVPAIWIHPADVTQSLVLASDDNAGIAVYDLEGRMLQFVEQVEGISGIDLRYNFPLNGELTTLVVGAVKDTPQIALYTIDAAARRLNLLQIVEAHDSARNVCMYHSRRTGEFYAFVSSEDGDFDQYQLTSSSGQVAVTLVRAFSLDSTIGECVVDDELGNLFIAEEEIALWRYSAEPDADNSRQLVDVVDGEIDQEYEGLAIYYRANGSGYLVVSNQEGFVVYERGGDQAFVADFVVTEANGMDGVEDPNGIDVVNLPLNERFAQGLFVTADEINTGAEHNNFKWVAWDAIATSLGLQIDTSYDPRIPVAPQVIGVRPSGETEPVPSTGDAADDVAIWIHPTDTALSTIIATDKRPGGGLFVYDLEGSALQFVDAGRMNNVDLRYNFPLSGVPTTIVVASNRDENGLSIFRVNPETRFLENIGAETIVSDMDRVDGVCMYHSASSGKYYAFVTSPNVGEVEQYELFDNGSGQVAARSVREFVVGSQAEGCTTDDELGYLYLNEELVGIWKYGAEPDAGETRTLVDTNEEGGHLTADVEGIAIYYGSGGTGYLIVSSQGSSEFVVYTRARDNAYVGTFRVVDGDFGDEVSNTDGIDVTNFALGDAYPQGLFVAQDGANSDPDANQNFKLVAWEDIAAALGLTIDTSHDPRSVGAS